jgi:hypothetical protein
VRGSGGEVFCYAVLFWRLWVGRGLEAARGERDAEEGREADVDGVASLRS